MKPIYSINGTGTHLFSIIAHMCTSCSKGFANRPFAFKQTVVMMEPTPPSLQMPNGGMVYTVTMIFEAESQADIDNLVQDPPEALGILKVIK